MVCGKKFLVFIFTYLPLGFLVLSSCSSVDRVKENPAYVSQPQVPLRNYYPKYPVQQRPYSRRYTNPYALPQNPYPYYDYDQYYVPPTEYRAYDQDNRAAPSTNSYDGATNK